ncbi:MAG: hypothetical protein KAQ87_00445 [Candidatus Pacebacteria bacterium]|nr:hypothetical protein [Candidatus Paceibacterota bacterium]
MYFISKGEGTVNAIRFTVILGYEGNTEGVKNIIVNSGLEIIKWIIYDTAVSRKIFVRVKGRNSIRINKLIKVLLEERNRNKYKYEIIDERSFVL